MEISDGENNFIKSLSKEIEKQACIFTIDKLQEGKYSFRLFHDENNNGKLDTNWIGIPTEGYGFSNNAKSSFGPPAFKKTIFDLKGKVLQKCDLSYF